MRKILPLTFLLLSLQSLISQNLNIAGHSAVDKTGDMISINSKVFYLGSSQNNCCGYSTYVQGMNFNGDTVFKTGLPSSYQVRYFGKIIKTNDNAILVSHYAVHSCDISGHLDYITKVDTNGVILFNIPIQGTLAAGGFGRTINDITQHSDNSYYLVSSTDLYHFSSSGQFISKITTSLTSITLVKALATGNLFVSGKLNGINTNVIMTTSGTVLTQQPCINLLSKVIDTPTYFYTKTGANTLDKYDTSLVLISSFGFSTNTAQYKVNDFTMRNDSVFIAGNMNSSGALYHAIIDTAFNILYQIQSTYKGIYPTGIALNNRDNLTVLATCNSKEVPLYKFSSLFQFPIGGGFSSVSDIGVVGFSNMNTTLFGIGNGSSFVTPYVTADVTVKNFATDTVKNFYINYYSYINTGISPCYILLHKFVDTAIIPGGSLTIPTVTFYAQPFPAGNFTLSQITLNICLFTTVPNASNDINIDNDAFCDSVLFTVTGLQENAMLAQNIQVYPNPSAAGFTVSSDIEIKTIELINSLGQTINKQSINGKECYLIGASLKPGIYFVKLETETGSVLKKVIKN
ncbi:T9SS type A sorting domain-containing protein [Aurantibacillus circumpalustris]|uniref:T9SS type A sorting domain-containing protein n=1 Tax=Aurantibacillus circumpalustris TaxID=3036359 RepID=UPI00295B5128|nr:T9SS type A sorting domain-containing protein [Aurantibacillus circumpalustris]